MTHLNVVVNENSAEKLASREKGGKAAIFRLGGEENDVLPLVLMKIQIMLISQKEIVVGITGERAAIYDRTTYDY